MLFPEKMSEVTIIVHNDYFDNLINELHERGWLQLIEYGKSNIVSNSGLRPGSQPLKRIEVLSELILSLSQFRDILERTEPEPGSFYSSLKSYKPPVKKPVEIKPISQTIQNGRELVRKLNYISSLDSELNNRQLKKNNLQIQLDKMKLFEKVNIDLNLFVPTRNVVIKIGLTMDAGGFKKDLVDALSDEVVRSNRYALYFHRTGDEENELISIVILPVTELGNARRVFTGKNFKELDMTGYEGTPSRLIGRLNADLTAEDNRIQKLNGRLKDAYTKHFEELSIVLEELRLNREKLQAFSNFGETASTRIICGWCMTRNKKRLKQRCEKLSSGHVTVTFREPNEIDEEKIPSQLNNPDWAQPFEMLTTTFAFPKYREIDPTIIIAPLFILFFSIMLGDAGYGMLILAFSIFGYVKFRDKSKIIKNLSTIGIYAGITTIIFGFIMGAFFGDLIPRFIYKDPDAMLYSLNIGGLVLPYDSFRNPMPLFIVSLIIGLFIINLGLVLGAVQNIRDRKFKDLITNQISWFIIQPPAILLIGHSMLKFWTLPGNITLISSLILLAGIILLALKYGVSTPFQITGLMGDWLSFARLLALSLATFGMAFTFNLIGELFLNAASGTISLVIFSIIAFIILVVAHLINLVLQTLGASIHALRLQFIELFNRCYEGGGVPFKPFRTRRVYTKVKTADLEGDV